VDVVLYGDGNGLSVFDMIVAGLIFPKTMATPNPMRFIGALGTYDFGLALAIQVIWKNKITASMRRTSL